jgi:ABC-2 type transport system ATP-binding protein
VSHPTPVTPRTGTYATGVPSPPPGAADAAPALAVDGLVKAYHGTTVVDDLTLSAERGQVTCLLGPNGAGKTTTVEICQGLRRADRGRVRVLGLDPVADGPRLRPRIGVMLQEGGLPPGARAGDVLTHLARLHANPQPPRALLDLLDLGRQARTTVRRLSGGERTRLAFAAALVGRPEFVFLDEPNAGLDPRGRHAVGEIVTALRADGVTVLLSTHQMDEAERLADEIVIVDRGTVVARGTPGELTAGGDGRLRFTARPGLDLSGLHTALPSVITVSEVAPGHYLARCPQVTDLGPQVIATVATWCSEQGVNPEGLAVQRRTLEDVFLDLTGRTLR